MHQTRHCARDPRPGSLPATRRHPGRTLVSSLYTCLSPIQGRITVKEDQLVNKPYYILTVYSTESGFTD